LLLVGTAGLAALAAVVLLLVRTPGALDERTFADQRNGLVADEGSVAPSIQGVRFGGRVVVLLFVRGWPAPGDVAAWRAQIGSGADVRVVVQTPQGAGPTQLAGVQVVRDPGAKLAAALYMPVPNDQGSPVGYAVVDRARHVRYATLDRSWAGNGFEVATMTRAVS